MDRVVVKGKPAIEHGSRLKVRIRSYDGAVVDRIPAWIHYATQESNEMQAGFNGIFWNPPKKEQHSWYASLCSSTQQALLASFVYEGTAVHLITQYRE